MKLPYTLKSEAQEEAYTYFDKNIRPLPKLKNGKVNPVASGLDDNDVDAFRHAYTSGVFTQEYSESAADTLGRWNEMDPRSVYSNSHSPGSENMDLWNNAVGRKYGKKTKNRKDLIEKIHKALKNGELIVDPSDLRKFEGAKQGRKSASKSVIVLKENKNGRNKIFYDTAKQTTLTQKEFVAQIQAGDYPIYREREPWCLNASFKQGRAKF